MTGIFLSRKYIPSSNLFFHCHNPIKIQYITRIRLGLSHLREHKSTHSFQDTLNLICNCGNDVESAINFFLHCPLYSNERPTLLNSLVNIDHMLLDNTDFSLTQILLFGNTTFNAIVNTKIINLTIDFVLSTTRFDEPVLWRVFFFFCFWSYPFNYDSSDNKRILSDVSPGLLDINDSFTGW